MVCCVHGPTWKTLALTNPTRPDLCAKGHTQILTQPTFNSHWRNYDEWLEFFPDAKVSADTLRQVSIWCSGCDSLFSNAGNNEVNLWTVWLGFFWPGGLVLNDVPPTPPLKPGFDEEEVNCTRKWLCSDATGLLDFVPEVSPSSCNLVQRIWLFFFQRGEQRGEPLPPSSSRCEPFGLCTGFFFPNTVKFCQIHLSRQARMDAEEK